MEFSSFGSCDKGCQSGDVLERQNNKNNWQGASRLVLENWCTIHKSVTSFNSALRCGSKFNSFS
jgi:hypothetical protein